MALFGAEKLKFVIKSLEIEAQTFIVLPCLNSPYQKLIFVIDFQPMRELKFLDRFTLESGIVVPVGIVVLVGQFARFDKRTGGHFHLQIR